MNYEGLFKGCKKKPIDIIIPLIVYSVFIGLLVDIYKKVG